MKKGIKILTFFVMIFVFSLVLSNTKVNAYASETRLYVDFAQAYVGKPLFTYAKTEDDSYVADIVNWYKGGSTENPGEELEFYEEFEEDQNYIVEVEIRMYFEEVPENISVFSREDRGEIITYDEEEMLLRVRFNVTPKKPQKDCVVTFDMMGKGDFQIPDQIVQEGDMISGFSTPTWEDYFLLEWCRDPELTQVFDIYQEIVEDDMTLYANWVKYDSFESEKINEINFEIHLPNIGDLISIPKDSDGNPMAYLQENNLNVKLPENAGYYVIDTLISEPSDEDSEFYIPLDGKIEYDKEYDIYVSFEAAEGYTFMHNTVIKINGKEIEEKYVYKSPWFYGISFPYTIPSEKKDVKEENPATGDNILLAGTILTLSALGMYCIGRKELVK